MQLEVTTECFRLAQAFTISRGSRTEAEVVTVRITRGGVTGWGEAVPYARYGETITGVMEEIKALPAGFTRGELQSLLPSGAARNAVDCALWDLEAKEAGRPAWQLAGMSAAPQPQITAYTLSLGSASEMEAQARSHAARPLLKVKLGGEGDVARIKAVRNGAPKARIIVDANEGWSLADYQALAPVFVELGVEMVEQPLPAGEDDALIGLPRPLPVCADESCHDRASLTSLRGKYDMINIKLDKTGGLTEALALKEAAQKEGYQIMVGCMIGSSLAMAPALLVAQGAEVVDLDAPLLLAEDRLAPLHYDNAGVHPAQPALWG